MEWTKSPSPRVLIPAAGFGRRVGTPPAKELLPDEAGNPMIAWSLKQIEQRSWSTTVIVRRDKRELIEFLRGLRSDLVNCLEIDSSRDWPETLLLSQSVWADKNIVVLPDTRFTPETCLDEISILLDKNDAVFATFEGEMDLAHWGIVSEATGEIVEKPKAETVQRYQKGSLRPWGLFGFRKEVGGDLLAALLESALDHQPKRVPGKLSTLGLTSFRDLSRG